MKTDGVNKQAFESTNGGEREWGKEVNVGVPDQERRPWIKK